MQSISYATFRLLQKCKQLHADMCLQLRRARTTVSAPDRVVLTTAYVRTTAPVNVDPASSDQTAAWTQVRLEFTQYS